MTNHYQYADPGCIKCHGAGVAMIDGPYKTQSGTEMNGIHAEGCLCGKERMAASIIKESGIPKKRLTARLDNYEPKTAAQVKARGRIIDWVQTWSPDSPGLLLDGPTGTGKTHLACAAAIALANRGVATEFTNVPRWLMDQRAAMARGFDGDAILEKSMRVDLLIFDDLGAERITDFAEERIYMLIDTRSSEGRPMIVTTNLEAEGWTEHIGPRVLSRIMEVCLPIRVDGPDHRMMGVSL